jgi:uracil-DNA glycosylase family 4
MSDNRDQKSLPLNLQLLHERIRTCRKCEGKVSGYKKPNSMNRGDAGKIIIIGQGPGKSEIVAQVAFSGPAGTRLNSWLVDSGATPEAPRKGIYLTSITKCQGDSLPVMTKECQPFLYEQIGLLAPELIITLGKPAYEAVSMVDTTYDHALCKLYNSADYVLLTPMGAHFFHLVWPHPSGLNRWQNASANQLLLRESFAILQPFIKRAQQ